jgi:hypothetical protein
MRHPGIAIDRDPAHIRRTGKQPREPLAFIKWVRASRPLCEAPSSDEFEAVAVSASFRLWAR